MGIYGQHKLGTYLHISLPIFPLLFDDSPPNIQKLPVLSVQPIEPIRPEGILVGLETVFIPKLPDRFTVSPPLNQSH